MLVRISLIVLTAALLSGAAGPEPVYLEPPAGFEVRPLYAFDPTVPFERQLGGLGYSPAGEPVVYENGEVRLYAEGGPRVLASFDPPVFGSFVVASPDRTSIWFGESSEGGIYRVALDGSGAELLARSAGNFDLAFAPPAAPESIRGRAFVSAPGPSSGNSIWVVEPGGDPGVDEVVTAIPGFSGPVTFDGEGNLYYITSTFEETRTLARVPPDRLAAGLGEGAIDFATAEVLLDDLEGAFGLRWLDGRLWLTNLGFVSGAGGLEVVEPDENWLHSLFAPVARPEGPLSPTLLAVHAGSLPFAPGSGEAGGRILVAYSDYSTLTHVVEIVPELHFVRGEVNGDGKVDISDAIYLLGFLFGPGAPPSPREAGDVNADGREDLSDPIYLLDFLFRGGAEIPAPYPEAGSGGR